MSLMAVSAYCENATPVVEKMNESCPVNMGEGCTLTSVTMGDSALVFLFNISDEIYGNLEPMKDILHDTMVAEYMTSQDPMTKQVVVYCRESGLGIVQRYMSAAGKSFDVTITAADLKD